MPSLVGGFGKNSLFFLNNIPNFSNSSSFNLPNKSTNINNLPNNNLPNNNLPNSQLGPYLAGLVEGDGTIAVHDKNSTAKKYSPIIIIVFKKADLPLAQFLQTITNCGTVNLKPGRGYVLWQIHDLVGVFTIVNLINGHMRTPKIEALGRTINWFNEYIQKNQNSKLPSTQSILSQIHPIELKELDTSPIDSNAWLAGLSDSDSNFSINIHQRKGRKGRKTTRVQLYFRIELRQNYHRLAPQGQKVSYFSIMSIMGTYFGVTVNSRTRIQNDKEFYSFYFTASSKISIAKAIEYFDNFPLLSSKHLDYKDWCKIFQLQNANPLTSSYLEIAKHTRKDYNKTRTSYNWDHLKDCYLTRIK
uniref:Homing endonuclease LAGLIDADG domain-containing protein n=1 Tax=Wolfiporia cocos TaxID=81056 RepID=A0A7G7YDU8_9APHY|nr:hypothetical protein [Wolfiporia cocos]QNH92668.1 hypothetical protein [Wolfiporia cocos]